MSNRNSVEILIEDLREWLTCADLNDDLNDEEIEELAAEVEADTNVAIQEVLDKTYTVSCDEAVCCQHFAALGQGERCHIRKTS